MLLAALAGAAMAIGALALSGYASRAPSDGG
jgi:hypothetical protein